MNNPDHARLAHLPVSLFSIVMGTTGLAIAWKRAAHALGAPDFIWQTIALLAAGLFLVLLGLYAAKLLRHSAAVTEELHHPVRINFFPTISISLFLLSIAAAGVLPGVSSALWHIGVVIHLGFTLIAMSSWIHHTHYDIKHMNPAWFIPVVGNLFVPIVGVSEAPADVSWFFFSVGIVSWLVLLTIVMNRLFFHAALPDRLTPTLFILIAPPAVGFVSWLTLNNGLDAFGRILYSFGLFLTLLLASNALRFVRLPFFVSSWAYSFPLAAITIASFAMHAQTGAAFHLWTAGALLALVSALVLFLAGRTVLAVRARSICQPE